MQNFDLKDLFRLGGLNPLSFLYDNKDKAYARGVGLALPIQLINRNGEKADVFSDSSYFEFQLNKGIVDGELSDPISGRTLHFTDAKSFSEAQRLLADIREEELEKQLHDKVIAAQMNMLSSAGGAEQTESQYKSAVDSLKNFATRIGNIAGMDVNNYRSELHAGASPKDKYNNLLNAVDSLIAGFDDAKKDAVVDAIKADISFMSLSELMQFASRFPGLDSVISSRLALIKKAGLSPQGAQMKSGQELSELITEHKRSALVENFRERSDALDFGVVKLSPKSIGDKDFNNKANWYPTIYLA